MKTISGIITLILFASVLTGCGEPSPEQKAKDQARGAIKICWQDYNKKSLDPGTKRFVARVCEKMEKDFRDKYHLEP